MSFSGRAQVPREDKIRLPQVGEAALVLHLAKGREEAAVVVVVFWNAQDVDCRIGLGRQWQSRHRRHSQVHGSQLRVIGGGLSGLFFLLISFYF